jgi:hypothetical protein
MEKLEDSGGVESVRVAGGVGVPTVRRWLEKLAPLKATVWEFIAIIFHAAMRNRFTLLVAPTKHDQPILNGLSGDTDALAEARCILITL